MSSDAARINTIRQLALAGSKKAESLDHVCYAHLKAVGGHCGLQTKMLKREELQIRIQIFYQHHEDLDALRTDPLHYFWFRRADRPAVPVDRLGIYSTKPISQPQLTAITDSDAARLVKEITGSENAWPIWLEEGSLNVSRIFAWMFVGITIGEKHEAGIGPLIEDEFLMYKHHQREINGKPNRGWLRTMLYLLTQQLIRQDPQYWMLYVAMRPDHNQRLVSYPYYTKFARPGDSTVFRHMDMNIPEFLATSRGGNIIQESVSLDDKTAATGCTEI
ncbi:hypothetical protein GJ744_000746 [Endocarpon pusillum]|uniref:Uncharacterized protein n=1 Tax=Endocarpon pusillum TaxID=364733 RepID=A0A8H7ACG3_9EURO|nr:hypothetical protein GJ744_000746 [Endocarpon pusillum]